MQVQLFLKGLIFHVSGGTWLEKQIVNISIIQDLQYLLNWITIWHMGLQWKKTGACHFLSRLAAPVHRASPSEAPKFSNTLNFGHHLDWCHYLAWPRDLASFFSNLQQSHGQREPPLVGVVQLWGYDFTHQGLNPGAHVYTHAHLHRGVQ